MIEISSESGWSDTLINPQSEYEQSELSDHNEYNNLSDHDECQVFDSYVRSRTNLYWLLPNCLIMS